jgi:hypothetical protein
MATVKKKRHRFNGRSMSFRLNKMDHFEMAAAVIIDSNGKWEFFRQLFSLSGDKKINGSKK